MDFVKIILLAFLIADFESVIDAAPVGVKSFAPKPRKVEELFQDDFKIDIVAAPRPSVTADEPVDPTEEPRVSEDITTFIKAKVDKAFEAKTKKVVTDENRTDMKLCGLLITVIVVALLFGCVKLQLAVEAVKLSRKFVGRFLMGERGEREKCVEDGFTIDDVFEDTECPKAPSDIFSDII